MFLLLFLSGGSGCISCEFAEMILVTIAVTAGLEDCSCKQFSANAIIGWGCREGEEGIVG